MTAGAGPGVVFLCGPRSGGNSDAAGLAFARGLARAGGEAEIVRLRDHTVAPCRGCGTCARKGHRCPLARPGDAAEALFEKLRAAPVAAFAAPIYFYHVPALFKALIDRAQRHYEARLAAEAAAPTAAAPPARAAHVLLVAGRPRGERLFEGTLLTLKYFLWPFHLRPAEPCLLRGLDAPGDLAADAGAMARVEAYGEDAGRGT
uniref:NADPH-dependent FMN reductase n=1 Tax=Desulfovibrio sp. U5L TaxID=596152 RepID=I2Q672_9BACT